MRVEQADTIPATAVIEVEDTITGTVTKVTVPSKIMNIQITGG